MSRDKHKEKAKANYKTKLPIYLFRCCIDDISPRYDDFLRFELDEKIIKEYACNYMQAELNEDIKEIPVKKIDEFIKKHSEKFQHFEKKYLEQFEKVFPKVDFDVLLSQKICTYCGITEDQINKLGIAKKLCNKRAETRGYTLEIDRMSPNKEYTIDNCCMSCYWCNNAKTDEFSVEEFKEVARSINAIWKSRGVDITDFDKLDIWQKIKES